MTGVGQTGRPAATGRARLPRRGSAGVRHPTLRQPRPLLRAAIIRGARSQIRRPLSRTGKPDRRTVSTSSTRAWIAAFYREAFFWGRPPTRRSARYTLGVRKDAGHVGIQQGVGVIVRASVSSNAKHLFDEHCGHHHDGDRREVGKGPLPSSSTTVRTWTVPPGHPHCRGQPLWPKI